MSKPNDLIRKAMKAGDTGTSERPSSATIKRVQFNTINNSSTPPSLSSSQASPASQYNDSSSASSLDILYTPPSSIRELTIPKSPPKPKQFFEPFKPSDNIEETIKRLRSQMKQSGDDEDDFIQKIQVPISQNTFEKVVVELISQLDSNQVNPGWNRMTTNNSYNDYEYFIILSNIQNLNPVFNLLPDNAIKIYFLPNCASYFLDRNRDTHDIILRFVVNDLENEYSPYNKFEINLGKHFHFSVLVYHDVVMIVIYNVNETISPLIHKRFK